MLPKKTWRGALERADAVALEEMEGVLRQLAHADRLRIIDLLNEAGELPVCEITRYLGIAQAATSKHLAQMRRLGLLRAERRGQAVWYSVADERPVELLRCVCRCCENRGPAFNGKKR